MNKFLLVPVIVLVVSLLVGVALISMSGSFYGGKIAVLRIKGTITSSSSILEQTVSPEAIFPLIDKIESDPSIKGALIEIDSPGGSVVASREIAMAVRDMKKPTVCWMGDIAASGAYWIASTCDTIIADPLTLTGSVGVTASYLQFVGTMEKYGVGYERFVSGENKDAGSPFRNLTDEERQGMSRLVNETFSFFLEDVRGNRQLSDSEIDVIKSGDVFLGKDAINLGLVDELGTWQDAKNRIMNVTGLPEAEFVEMQKSGFSLLDLLSAFG